ncbi:MAG: NTP transferase domain-containing protein [Acholeplasmataceae bacterium]
MAEGIILAAGYASRAQANKMLFLVDGKPLIDHVIAGMRPCVNHIYVVTGHYHEAIASHLRDEHVTCAFNPNYQEGMFSSVKRGVRAVVEDFFVIPGDCPFVSRATYQRLMETDEPISVPVYGKRKGHPIFISIALKRALLESGPDMNLKAFRDRYDYEAIAVDDSHIIDDIDTLADLAAFRKGRT